MKQMENVNLVFLTAACPKVTGLYRFYVPLTADFSDGILVRP
jgi:hypothetical protein